MLFASALILVAGIGLGWHLSRTRPPEPAASAQPTAAPEERPDAGLLPPAGAMAAVKPMAASREFRRLSESDREVLEGLIRGFDDEAEVAGQLEILERIEAGPYGVAFLGLARKVLSDPSAGSDLRLRVVEMLAGNTSPEILPVLELVRASEVEEERRLAVLAAARVRSGETLEFIAGFLADPGKNVRFAALETAIEQPRDSRDELLVRAMHGKHEDVGFAGLAELELEASPAAVDVLMRGLDSPQAAVRDEVLRSAGFLLDEEFTDAKAARAWWSAHRGEFDRNLNRIE